MMMLMTVMLMMMVIMMMVMTDADDDYHDVLTRSLLCLEFRLFSLLDRALHHDVFSCPEQLDTDDR